VKVEQEFDTIIKVDGKKITVYAPSTASIGSFNPMITLIRDKNPINSVSVLLPLTIARCIVN
jgi:hypothetical protein